MDQESGSSSADQASLRSLVKSVINTYQTPLRAAEPVVAQTGFAPTISQGSNYEVGDLFGRCLLRVCFWLDVFMSLARGYEAHREDPQPFAARSLEPAVPPLADMDAVTDSASDGLAPA